MSKRKAKSLAEQKILKAEIKKRYNSLEGTLTERSRRLFVGSEALTYGYGGITAVSLMTGVSPKVVSRGLKECQAIEKGETPELAPNRVRRAGGGRKKTTEKYPDLLRRQLKSIQIY